MPGKDNHTQQLAELRVVRDDIKAVRKELLKLEKELGKLEADRDERVQELGKFEKSTAARLAPAAGLDIAAVVALVPHLGPQRPATAPQTASGGDLQGETAAEAPEGAYGPSTAPKGALAPDLSRPTAAAAADDEQSPAPAADDADDQVPTDVVDEPLAQHHDETTPRPQVAIPAPARPGGQASDEADHPQATAAAEASPARPPATAPAEVAPAAPVGEARELPSIPDGERGDAWCTVAPNLFSKRPNFTQAARQMAFLDTTTGVLVWRDQTARVDLGAASAGEILAAVYATVPDSVERIYITAGDPWHRDAERYGFLRDAVSAWLNAPIEGWGLEESRGKDRLAGHFVHERNPVGRWQRGEQHTEIRSVGEWFTPEGADPATVRDAFVMLWKELHRSWPDVVLMGSPAQTGRDLWSRTIPAKTGAKWSEGYPVMSEEIRGLLHATAGQGRTELITPPRVPEKLPRLVEFDRTFAYAKHTWMSAVGAPRRLTARAFRGLSQKEQKDALFAPSHWQIRVTVPDDWDHVGILPAPAVGDRAWYYPAEPGQTFTTWAGGAEVNLALRNAVRPWKVEILDGLVWEAGTPLREWSSRLKTAWSTLRSLAQVHADERQSTAAHLASRAVRSIMLYGIGAFAQRPRATTGSVPVGSEHEVPAGAQIIGSDGQSITWQRAARFSRDPYAHPEWAAGVWSGARAALLSTRMREDDVSVGALHLPPGSVVAFRTDAIYTTADVSWPYHGQPGDYLKKGQLSWPVAPPWNEDELLSLQGLGRAALAEQQGVVA